MDSDLEISVQEVYYKWFLGSTGEGRGGKQDKAEEEVGPSPRGALELGWLSGVVSSWVRD